MTHRTSVWLPERVGSASALSEARRGSSAWSQWVTDPLTDHVQLGDTPLEKHNKPASSCLPETNTCSVSNGTLSPIFGASQVTWGRKKKKKERRRLWSWKWYPDDFKDWVQIMCIPASLTGFCNFLQMRPFEVNWSQGCGVPRAFIACVEQRTVEDESANLLVPQRRCLLFTAVPWITSRCEGCSRRAPGQPRRQSGWHACWHSEINRQI